MAVACLGEVRFGVAEVEDRLLLPEEVFDENVIGLFPPHRVYSPSSLTVLRGTNVSVPLRENQEITIFNFVIIVHQRP